MADTVDWIVIRVDEDGRMIVRDVVEGIESKPIETVMVLPGRWPGMIAKAIMDLLQQAGMDVTAG